ncbi:MAG TPA: hypothetical protein VFU71_20250 [Burkholderiaceae bacterium]|nr:hypothetical protein [Burkholderiaceae bacterium]
MAHHDIAIESAARLTTFIALAALLASSWRHVREIHQRHMAERPDAKPEKLQMWEDEGGQSHMPDKPSQ